MNTTLLRARRSAVAALVSFALLCGALVYAPSSEATTPSANMAYAIAGEVYKLVNAERALVGRPPLHPNSRLASAAHGHNLKMAQYNTMSHLLPGELSLGGRCTRAGYLPWSTVGENVAWNSNWSLTGAQYVQNLMFNEVAPNNGHRLNIISTSFVDFGIDVYMDALHHKMWITEDFGHLQ